MRKKKYRVFDRELKIGTVMRMLRGEKKYGDSASVPQWLSARRQVNAAAVTLFYALAPVQVAVRSGFVSN